MHRQMTNGGGRRPTKLYDDSDDERLELKIDSIGGRNKEKTTGFVYVLTFFSALGGFLFGYDTGVIAGALILLRNEFELSLVWEELIVSVTVASAALFALVGGYFNDRLGRRPVILSASVIFTVGALCMGIAGDRYLLLAGRIIVGAGIGLTSTTIPMYLAECSPAHARGRLVSTYVTMVACGQFVASIVDGLFGLYRYEGWRFMLGLAGIPSFLQFLGFIFMPESPRWLLINDCEERARRVLQSMRGYLDIDDEFDSIKNSCIEIEKSESNRPIIIQMLMTPSVRRALIVGCSLQLFQQLAGINTVMYYSATIIRMAGVKNDEAAIWLSAMTSAVNFLFTIVGLYLVERIGRRALTLGSLMGAVVSLAWLAISFQLSSMNTPAVTSQEGLQFTNSSCAHYSVCDDCMKDLSCGYCYADLPDGVANASCLPADYEEPWKSSAGRCNQTHLEGTLTWAYDYCPTKFSWMPLIGMVFYLMFFAPGMGPMPWTINSEIYPLWARSTGNAASTFTNWIVNLAMSMSFLSLTQALTRFGTFWLYTGLAFLGFLTLAFLVPETKGKSLEELEGLFAQPWCNADPVIDYNTKTIQYVHIRGLNRDGRESELDSPE